MIAGSAETTAAAKADESWRRARQSRDLRNTTPPKKAEDLAFRIENLVMERGWPIGELLGSEAELIEWYQVSRAVLREAVRILEHHGVARMRRGPSGGLVVTAPAVDSLRRPTTLFLDYANVARPDLEVARLALEVAAVGVVAGRRTEEDVARLTDVLEKEREIGADGLVAGPSDDFHVLLSKLSRNPVLELFIDTVANLTFEHTLHRDYSEEELEGFYRAHERILDAIIEKDIELAQELMREHVTASLAHYQRRGESSA